MPHDTIREQLEQREREILAPQAAKSADSRGRLRPEPEDDDPAGVSARSRPHHPLQGVPPPEAQDAGVLRADRRSLPHAADAHARGLADRAQHRQGAAAERGADRSDRARPRSRAHAVRPRRRARAQRARCPAASTTTSRACASSTSSRTTARGLNLTWEVRDGIAQALERQERRAGRRGSRASRQHDRRADRARRRHHRLRQPRHRRCGAGGAAAAKRICRATRVARARATRRPSGSARMVTDVVHRDARRRADRDPDERARCSRRRSALRSFLFDAVYENDDRDRRVQEGGGHPRRAVGEGPRAARPSSSIARTIDDEGLDAAARDFLAGMTDRYAVSLFEQLFIPEALGGRTERGRSSRQCRVRSSRTVTRSAALESRHPALDPSTGDSSVSEV